MREQLLVHGVVSQAPVEGIKIPVPKAGPASVFSPIPVLASWRTRSAEPAPTTGAHQPTEERFLYLLRRSLSKKADNRLSPAEQEEVDRVQAKLLEAEMQEYMVAAQAQRKALKQLPRAERHALEVQSRVRTEMQMMELELRGSDIQSLAAAVDRLDRGVRPVHKGDVEASLELAASIDSAGPSTGALSPAHPGQAQSPDPAQAAVSQRATHALIRQLLHALQVERARSSRLERLLAEAATAATTSAQGGESSSRGRGGGGAAALSRQESYASGESEEGGSTDQSGSQGKDGIDRGLHAWLFPASPLTSPQHPPSSAPRCSPIPLELPPMADAPSANAPIPPAATGSVMGAGQAQASVSNHCLSSPLTKRVHTSIESEVARLQQCTEQLLAASLAGSDIDAGGSGALAALVKRSAHLSQDVHALRQLTRSSTRREALTDLSRLLANLEAYVATLRAEIHLSQSASLEAAYEAMVACSRRIVDVPSDGDCLFHSAARGLTSPALGGAAAPPLTAADLRGRCMRLLADQPHAFEADVRRAAQEALSATSEPEVSKLDPSSKALREYLTSWHGPAVTAESLTLPHVVAAYCAVRGRPGVFGERLEARLLAQVLQREVHLFYRDGAAADPGAASDGGGRPSASRPALRPAEVLRPERVTQGGAAGPPLELLCSLAKRHYRLLVPLSTGDAHPNPLLLPVSVLDANHHALSTSGVELPGPVTPAAPTPTGTGTSAGPSVAELAIFGSGPGAAGQQQATVTAPPRGASSSA